MDRTAIILAGVKPSAPRTRVKTLQERVNDAVAAHAYDGERFVHTSDDGVPKVFAQLDAHTVAVEPVIDAVLDSDMFSRAIIITHPEVCAQYVSASRMDAIEVYEQGTSLGTSVGIGVSHVQGGDRGYFFPGDMVALTASAVQTVVQEMDETLSSHDAAGRKIDATFALANYDAVQEDTWIPRRLRHARAWRGGKPKCFVPLEDHNGIQWYRLGNTFAFERTPIVDAALSTGFVNHVYGNRKALIHVPRVALETMLQPQTRAFARDMLRCWIMRTPLDREQLVDNIRATVETLAGEQLSQIGFDFTYSSLGGAIENDLDSDKDLKEILKYRST